MSTKTKQKTTFSDMSPQDIVAMLVANAVTAKADLPGLRVGQKNGRIVILIEGWQMDDKGNIVKAD